VAAASVLALQSPDTEFQTNHLLTRTARILERPKPDRTGYNGRKLAQAPAEVLLVRVVAVLVDQLIWAVRSNETVDTAHHRSAAVDDGGLGLLPYIHTRSRF
jgi:hypothetical protein